MSQQDCLEGAALFHRRTDNLLISWEKKKKSGRMAVFAYPWTKASRLCQDGKRLAGLRISSPALVSEASSQRLPVNAAFPTAACQTVRQAIATTNLCESKQLQKKWQEKVSDLIRARRPWPPSYGEVPASQLQCILIPGLKQIA